MARVNKNTHPVIIWSSVVIAVAEGPPLVCVYLCDPHDWRIG